LVKDFKKYKTEPSGKKKAGFARGSAYCRRAAVGYLILNFIAACLFLFPADLYAATALLDEYVQMMQNGKLNKSVRISSISKHSTSPESPSELSEKISDDEFYEFMDMVSEAENEAFLNEIKNYGAADPVRPQNAEFFKTFGEYYITNKKPGYLLFSSDDEEYGYDYQTRGYSTGFSYKPDKSSSIDASYYKNATTEQESDEFSHQKVALSFSRKFLKNYKLSTSFNQLSSDSSGRLNEFGFDFDSQAGSFQWGGGFSKNVYAYDETSFMTPAYYRKYYFNAGYELASDFYLQLSPSYEDYFEDKNKKSEIVADLLYYPEIFPNMSFDFYYRTMGFKKSGDEDASFVYFTPENNVGMGISANYQAKIKKKTVLNFNLSLDNENYTYNGDNTTYYSVSALGKIAHSFNGNFRLEARYGFSLSQSDGFPFTQNMKVNTTLKF